MSKYFTAILAGLAALLAWLLRGFFAGRKEEKLTTQRDEARTHAQQQEIKAQAKQAEATLAQELKHMEDAINAANTDGVNNKLDNMFK